MEAGKRPVVSRDWGGKEEQKAREVFREDSGFLCTMFAWWAQVIIHLYKVLGCAPSPDVTDASLK